MIPFQAGTIVFVCGPVRSGKTFLIDQWCQSENRIVRFDATGETVEDPSLDHVWMNPKELWTKLTTKPGPYYFRIAYHPGQDIEQDFELCSKCLWRLADVHKVIVCDEFHEVCSVNDTPDWVKTILRYARHDHMGLIAASQRIPDVHKLFTSGADTVVLFHTTEARDLEHIEDRWRCADVVEHLRPLAYNDQTKLTTRKPQAVVKKKGQREQVWDFELDRFLNPGEFVPFTAAGLASANEEIESDSDSDESETDGGNDGLPPVSV